MELTQNISSVESLPINDISVEGVPLQNNNQKKDLKNVYFIVTILVVVIVGVITYLKFPETIGRPVPYPSADSVVKEPVEKVHSTIDKYIEYTLPDGWESVPVETGLELHSPDFAYGEDQRLSSGMRISVWTDAFRDGALDPQTFYSNIESGVDQASDVVEVEVIGEKAKKYYVDFESTHNLNYYLVHDQMDWNISFQTKSLAEEKKRQVIIDEFLENLKFKNSGEAKNNWKKYEGKTFSFKYPNSWSDATLRQLGTRTEVEIADMLVVSDGYFYDQKLGRNLHFDEYLKQVKESTNPEVVIENYSLAGFEGVRYLDMDNAGRVVINIILANTTDTQRIVNIFCLSEEGREKAKSVFDPILATFKFE